MRRERQINATDQQRSTEEIGFLSDASDSGGSRQMSFLNRRRSNLYQKKEKKLYTARH